MFLTANWSCGSLTFSMSATLVPHRHLLPIYCGCNFLALQLVASEFLTNLVCSSSFFLSIHMTQQDKKVCLGCLKMENYLAANAIYNQLGILNMGCPGCFLLEALYPKIYVYLGYLLVRCLFIYPVTLCKIFLWTCPDNQKSKYLQKFNFL